MTLPDPRCSPEAVAILVAYHRELADADHRIRVYDAILVVCLVYALAVMAAVVLW